MTSLMQRALRSPHSSDRFRVPSCSYVSHYLERVAAGLLAIYVFALPTDLRLWGDISVTLPIGSLCIAFGLLGVMKRGSIAVLPLGSWLLLAFVLWSTCTLLWATYPDSTVFKLVKYWEFVPITWVMAEYSAERRIRIRLMDSFVAGCVVGVLGTLWNFIRGHEFYIAGADGVELEKRYSWGTDVNFLALALVLGVVIAGYRSGLERGSWRKILFLSYIPPAVLAISLTGSRGGLLALLAAILIIAMCVGVKKRLAIFASVALVLAVAVSLPSSVTWRLSTTTDEMSNGTLDGRRGLWEQGVAIVEKHPWKGSGLGAAKGAFDYAAHNTPLELVMDGGTIGFVLFYGAVAYSLYRAWRVTGKERATLAGCCAAWVVGTLSISWDAHPITWFLFALLLSASSTTGLQARLVATNVARD